MRPRIKLRPPNELQSVLAGIKSADHREMVTILLQRYGTKRTIDLLPHQVAPFTRELKLVLSGNAPHPADSVLDPTTMEIR